MCTNLNIINRKCFKRSNISKAHAQETLYFCTTTYCYICIKNSSQIMVHLCTPISVKFIFLFIIYRVDIVRVCAGYVTCSMACLCNFTNRIPTKTILFHQKILIIPTQQTTTHTRNNEYYIFFSFLFVRSLKKDLINITRSDSHSHTVSITLKRHSPPTQICRIFSARPPAQNLI